MRSTHGHLRRPGIIHHVATGAIKCFTVDDHPLKHRLSCNPPAIQPFIVGHTKPAPCTVRSSRRLLTSQSKLESMVAFSSWFSYRSTHIGPSPCAFQIYFLVLRGRDLLAFEHMYDEISTMTPYTRYQGVDTKSPQISAYMATVSSLAHQHQRLHEPLYYRLRKSIILACNRADMTIITWWLGFFFHTVYPGNRFVYLAGTISRRTWNVVVAIPPADGDVVPSAP
ncbi:hypothetical protein BJ138DRAFT_649691 [Hygrophoropsis aurantiaca]|uniref:Uncharacterized protein n=1 Tax=Hygrophoropsis aurantiaca TaxID=72124 RepID=A0ACB8AJE0_9AGAM|nr:hypothetical protein BJ138DRAFT_649691 [Hygrophoropsis aurantiaca]